MTSKCDNNHDCDEAPPCEFAALVLPSATECSLQNSRMTTTSQKALQKFSEEKESPYTIQWTVQQKNICKTAEDCQI
jgi:hypothetical protein